MAKIGLAWVNPAPLTKPENVVNFAKKCEAMGCDSMWTIDRIAYDNLEPLTILAAAAGAPRKSVSALRLTRQHAPSGICEDHLDAGLYLNGRVTIGLGFVAANTTKPSRFL
jgi:alkanesulfonate monooxygenase SsuD/methylene tetrahydromethanopterin reductase-like flavin-dependent oxidoreductase (luciferase family)